MYVEFLDKFWVAGLQRKVLPGEQAEVEEAEAQVLVQKGLARETTAPKREGGAATAAKPAPETAHIEGEVEFEGRTARR